MSSLVTDAALHKLDSLLTHFCSGHPYGLCMGCFGYLDIDFQVQVQGIVKIAAQVFISRKVYAKIGVG